MAYRQSENRKRKLMKTYKQIKDQKSHGSGVWIDGTEDSSISSQHPTPLDMLNF